MAPPSLKEVYIFWRDGGSKPSNSAPPLVHRSTEPADGFRQSRPPVSSWATEEHAAELDKLSQEFGDLEKEHRREVSALRREIAELKEREESALSDRTQQEEEFRRKIRSLEKDVDDLRMPRQSSESLLKDEIWRLKKIVEDNQQENSSLRDRLADGKAAEESHRQMESAHLHRITELESEEARHIHTISTLKHNIDAVSKKAKEDYEREASGWAAEVSILKETATKYWWQVSNLEPEVDRLIRDNKRLDHALRKTEAKNKEMKAEMEKKVEVAHNYAKAILDTNKSFAASDVDIKAWFHSRSQSWYGWARDFAHSDPGRIAALSMKEKEELYSAIAPFVVLGNEGFPQVLAGKNTKRTMYVLLHAMLANFICTEVISSPFWYLKALDQGLPAQEAMEGLYQLFISLREPEAHQWRSAMSRIVSTGGMGQSGSLRGKGTPDGNHKLASYRRQYTQYLTAAFLDGPPRFLLCDKALSSTCAGKLAEEINNALKFSTSLWSGRSSIQKVGLSDFQQRFQGKFKHGSEEMELYRGTRGEDMEAYGDQPILVVVQPAIVAIGTEDGDEYDSARRVWMKAQVNVMEPAEVDL
ncbi:hypothetical protein B0T25DRAFT_569314 [Lasiosphaeria hispida]|uniref:Uncharacterized protein n=1 Tax=Lasiosphaeria hispida TaxID=260671 RepID=A0AAJ0HDP7_9PEZI|nr:hypothetical protein B0T25DRAFT_569314 [Lasiosphaeria hispida]